MKGMKGMRYKLPKMKSHGSHDSDMAMSPGMYERRVSIPVNDEILEYAEIGEECHISLMGTITGINSNESEDGYDSKTITLEIYEVEKYGDYEAERDFNKGMDGKMKRYK